MTQSAAGSTEEAKKLSQEAEDLQDTVRVLSEAGLFRNTEIEVREHVLEQLHVARQNLSSGGIVDARNALLRVATRLDESVHNRSWFWRLIFIHRAGLFLYLVMCLVMLLNIGSGYLYWIASDFWGVPAAALGLGAAGAILRSLYWLQRKVASREFRFQFALAHMAAPFIGALLGVFTWILLQAGLLMIQSGGIATIDKKTGPYALCFLAGFSWEWLLDWVQRFVNAQRGS